jgi:hypothetical protein
MKRMARTLNIYKRSKRNPDTPHDPLHPNIYALHGKKAGFETDIKEVWFVGAHCDVGGGLAKDTEEHALSNISLRWMVNEIVKAQCDIHFDESALGLWNMIPITAIKRIPIPMTREASDSTLRDEESELGLGQDMPDKYHASVAREANTSTSAPRHNSAGAPFPFQSVEDPLDAMDVAQKIGNALRKNVFWWILELVPTYHEWQDEDDEWVGKWKFHLGRGREVPPHPLFHKSVKTCIENPLLKYSPRAQYKKGTEKYVS